LLTAGPQCDASVFAIAPWRGLGAADAPAPRGGNAS